MRRWHWFIVASTLTGCCSVHDPVEPRALNSFADHEPEPLVYGEAFRSISPATYLALEYMAVPIGHILILKDEVSRTFDRESFISFLNDQYTADYVRKHCVADEGWPLGIQCLVCWNPVYRAAMRFSFAREYQVAILVNSADPDRGVEYKYQVAITQGRRSWIDIGSWSPRLQKIADLEKAMKQEVERLHSAGIDDGNGLLYRMTTTYQKLQSICTRDEMKAIDGRFSPPGRS